MRTDLLKSHGLYDVMKVPGFIESMHIYMSAARQESYVEPAADRASLNEAQRQVSTTAVCSVNRLLAMGPASARVKQHYYCTDVVVYTVGELTRYVW